MKGLSLTEWYHRGEIMLRNKRGDRDMLPEPNFEEEEIKPEKVFTFPKNRVNLHIAVERFLGSNIDITA